jgi:phosphoribosylformylglycinamidine cyclo-ligase
MSKKAKTLKEQSAYAAAGVDIDNKMRALSAIRRMVRDTATKGVLSEIGLFGGLFSSPGKDQILVASTDGVGTKLKVAAMAGRHDTVGQCLVNHCVNDILVQGARPLFFMDYIGTAKFDAVVFKDVIAGLCKACKKNGCALLGGETAEMPGLYPPVEYDLVGTIVGVVDRQKVVTGKTIRSGDVLIGLGSSGLQTNGFSLARKIIFDEEGLGVNDRFPGLRQTVADVLLAVHDSYLAPVSRLMERVQVHGMAHITGGGFPDNIPRILPKGLRAVVDRSTWMVPPVFTYLQHAGGVDREEMYRVFNMGIGFVVIVRPCDVERALRALSMWKRPVRVLGFVEAGRGGVKMLN